jgi:FkbM family methyltransferase
MGFRLRRVSEAARDWAPVGVYLRVHNLIARLKRYPTAAAVGDGSRLRIGDTSGKIEVCRRNRLWLYKRGVAHRLAALQDIYMLGGLDVPAGEAFVDCGANVGELGWFARARSLAYHAFEPEPLEADCCDANNFDGAARTNRMALWSVSTTLTFHSKPDTGDGSVLPIEGARGQVEVPATSLDDYIAAHGIERIGVLKIEAEGAEPEVLAGAERALTATRYVTVDCGFERGVAQESTAAPVINHLLRHGFELLAWNPKRCTFLFRNCSVG